MLATMNVDLPLYIYGQTRDSLRESLNTFELEYEYSKLDHQIEDFSRYDGRNHSE